MRAYVRTTYVLYVLITCLQRGCLSSREKQEMTLFEQAHMNQFRRGEITQYNVKSIQKKKLESLIYEYIKLVSVFSGIIPTKRK